MRWDELARLPSRARFHTKSFARLLNPLLKLDGKGFLDALRRQAQTERDAHAIRQSGLFQPDYYAKSYPDALSFDGGLLRHYLLLGGFEGCRPNPFFYSAWYLSTYPDLATGRKMNPLSHYVLAGSAERRNPNPYFSTQWYALQHAGMSQANGIPLRHYLEVGAAAGDDPSPRFLTQWYLAQNPDVQESGLLPLEHFLTRGLQDGRRSHPSHRLGGFDEPVTNAVIEYRKALASGKEVALFVTHSPNGKLKPHVRHYTASLRRQGIQVVLIVAADEAWFDEDAALLSEVDALVVRENRGLDFAAWAHILQIQPELFDCELLYLVNDSLIGPFSDLLFEKMLTRLRAEQADVIGLTESREYRWHIQSFFVGLRRTALASPSFQRFINGVAILPTKDEVIQQYEIGLAPTLAAAGLRCSALYPSDASDNRTLIDWKRLIAEGFPFIKVMALRDRIADMNTQGWQDVLRAQGFDTAIAEHVLENAMQSSPESKGDERTSRIPHRSILPRHLDGASGETALLFVGPWNYSNGLGVASRSYLTALRHTPFSLNLAPIKRPFHIHRRTAPHFDINDVSGPTDVAVIHLNPDAWPGLLVDEQKSAIDRARKRVGLWVWEMDSIPENWFPAFNSVDAIWAPSRYCQETFASAAKVPVHVIPHVVAVPTSLPAAAKVLRTKVELGLSANDRVILYVFDGASYLVRKNPFALVRAFAQSRLAQDGWKLVLKTKNLFDSPKQGEELSKLCAETPGVLLINRGLDMDAMHNMMAMADIYASPHCSEGFGLTVAEAMAMGKVVVATDYSGTRDFLDASCGFPVNYELEELKDSHGHYTRGNAWAKIDEKHLVESLREAARRIAAHDTSIGEQARNRVARSLSAQSVGALIQQSIQQIVALPHKA